MKKPNLSEFWRRSQAALVYLPLLLILSVGSYIVLRALDPRIGLEGLGDLFGYFVNGVRAVMVVAAAFWFKRIAFFDLHKPTELQLYERARDGDRCQPVDHWGDRHLRRAWKL